MSGYGLVAPGSGPALAAWAAALPPHALLFLDPGPLVAQIPPPVLDPVLARCDWLSCNAREAALLTDATAPDQAARRLLARTARANIIVRVGPDGCLLALRPPAATAPRPARPAPGTATAPGTAPTPPPATAPRPVTDQPGAPADGEPCPPALDAPPVLPARRRPRPRRRSGPNDLSILDTPSARDVLTSRPHDASSPVHVPGLAVHAVDTTGAGDAHAGVFLAALADGLPPTEAARRANAAAALAVTRPGPATSPDRAELDAWLARPSNTRPSGTFRHGPKGPGAGAPTARDLASITSPRTVTRRATGRHTRRVRR